MSMTADFVEPGVVDLASVTRSRAMVERSLSGYLVEEDVEPKAIHRAMRYAVLNGGHRWRPLLTMFAAEACGGSETDVLPAACAFELIHCSSLILDDLPCMDNAELRRDRPTCHRAFGEAVTVMASIALLSLAQRLVLENCRTLSVAPWATQRLLNDVLSLTASEGMIAGQFADLDNNGLPLDGTGLAAAHHSKTGLLCIAADKAGGLLAGASDRQIDRLERYAMQLGLAYQIQDDLQDAPGEPGASADSDAGKTTFVSFYGPSGAQARLRSVTESAFDALTPFGPRAGKLRELASRMVPAARG
jgi:geranylgeranyl diphosphate synthase type II